MSQTTDVNIVYKGDPLPLVPSPLTVGTVPLPVLAQDPNIALNVSGSQNAYFGVNVFNFGTGGTSSTDIVAGNNSSTAGASGTYTDFGMNGSNWSDSNYGIFDANAGYVYSQSNNLYLGAGTPGTLGLFAGGFASKAKLAMVIDPLQNIAAGTGAVGSAGTAGFFYIRGGAGVPTGVPQAKTGLVPMYYDTTNNNFYMYNGGWKKASTGGTWA